MAKKAEDSGVVLGIESWLSAAELVRILDAVGSRNVQVYYDVANSTQMGYDVAAEIRQLGRERICEFHAKENGFLLGQGRVDFAAVRKAMDDIGFRVDSESKAPCPKASRCWRATSRTCGSCGLTSRRRRSFSWLPALAGSYTADMECWTSGQPGTKAEATSSFLWPRRVISLPLFVTN